MSDTVKLIIEIPEEEYKRMTEESIYSTHVMICAIQNGTPLDEVTAEIHRANCYYHGTEYGEGIDLCEKILDKHIGKESEDT